MKKNFFIICILFIVVLAGCNNTVRNTNNVNDMNCEVLNIKANEYGWFETLELKINNNIYYFSNSEIFNPWVGADFDDNSELKKVCNIKKKVIDDNEYEVFANKKDADKLFILVRKKNSNSFGTILKRDLEAFPSFDTIESLYIQEIHEEDGVVNTWGEIKDGVVIEKILELFQREGENYIEDITQGGITLYKINLKAEGRDDIFVSLNIIENGEDFFLQSITPNYYNKLDTDMFKALQKK